MTLLNPYLLAGALLAAVPLLIHLLNRSRFRVERFGAMIFLRQAVAVRAQKLRLQQWLLLLLRCLFFAVLAVALARPVRAPRDGPIGQQPTTHVLVIDGSLSMHQGEGLQNAFHLARESALKLVAELPTGDNLQVIWGSRRPQPLFPRPLFDRLHLRSRLEALQPGYQAMNLPLALQQALWALEGSTLPRRRIYLLTDGQAGAWRLDDQDSWRRLAEHYALLKVKPFIYALEQRPATAFDNLAVVALRARSPLLDIYRPTTFVADLRNFGSTARPLTVDFAVDGERLAERRLTVPPGIHECHFEHQFETPGAHYVSVRITGDLLPADDARDLAVTVMRRVPVLVIEGQGGDDPWQADGGFLRLALAASGATGEDGLFEVVARPQSAMDATGAEVLRGFRCVVLANVSSVSDFFMFALERFVEGGGGLLIAPGGAAVASEYNRMFKDGSGLLPARLERVETYRQRFFQPLFPAGQASFVLDAFDLSRPRLLADAKVAKYWLGAPTADATVLARFGDHPFLVYRPFGDGRTILWTTSLGGEWNNLPLTRDYLPLVHNLIVFLSASLQPPINLSPGETILYSSERPVSGEPRPEYLHPASPPPTCHMRTPDGELHALPLSAAAGEWLGRWAETDRPGIYTATGDHLPSRHFAVQPDISESDLRGLTASEAEELANRGLPLVRVDRQARLAAEIQREVGGREWWQAILLLAVLLLCLETLASWRFSR